MTSEDGKRSVCWRDFIAVLSTVVGLLLTLGWIGWQVHAAHPHAGTVHREEYEGDINEIHSRLIRIEDKIDRLNSPRSANVMTHTQ